MNVTLQIPDDIADQLERGDLPRRALEALAIEEYRSGRLTASELRRLLGFETRYELDEFLKEREVWADYTIEDFRREIAALEKLGL